MSRYCILLLLPLSTLAAGELVAETNSIAARPLPNAHAHNDYYHQRPLLDALDNGFCSVEADIFLVDGKLLVAHGRNELKPHRTLESLYLDPLRYRVQQNGGRVFSGGPTFTLLVDIKSSAEPTYLALRDVLRTYADMLTTVTDGVEKLGAVSIVISGNRAKQLIADQNPRYVSIDGRLTDLESDEAVHLLPWISDRWGSHFKWRGSGPMSSDERRKLTGIVRKAHAAGRRVRFWATPESQEVWSELRAAGVDLINTDDLPGLRTFLETE